MTCDAIKYFDRLEPKSNPKFNLYFSEKFGLTHFFLGLYSCVCYGVIFMVNIKLLKYMLKDFDKMNYCKLNLNWAMNLR